jgi:hypothetical protein
MKPVWIGYFPKRRAKQYAWDAADALAGSPLFSSIEEVCSVSGCIARGVDPRTEGLEGNPFGGFNSLESARAAVPSRERSEFAIYAYALYPGLFLDGRWEPMELLSLSIEPVPGSFTRLGYDAVELVPPLTFGCSPLSCDNQSAIVPVNRHCLVSTEPEALELARRFSIERPRSAPFCVVEVWRETPTSTD